MRSFLLIVCCWAILSFTITHAANLQNQPAMQYTQETMSLSHPGVLTFPLSRSSTGNMKAAARAAAGEPAYQRLMQAMAHGAKLMSREEETMALPVTPLAGCPFADFTIPVTIGKSTFQLLVDTGSSTLAVAGSACTNCQGVSPLWAASASSTNQNKPATGSYGDATGWAGQIWLDRVALGDGALVSTNVTAFVSTRIAVIVQQSTANVDQSGNPRAGASNFFVTTPCADDTKRRGQIVTQGIIGTAFQALASAGTDSFMMQLFAQTTLPKIFSIQMCSGSGNMWLGGYDTSKMVSAPLFTPLITPPLYYSVVPTDMYVNGVALGFNAASWVGGPTIIDSGTTLWELPAGIYRAVVDRIISDNNFRKRFRSSATDNFFDHALGTCEMPTDGASWAILQQQLPTISIQMSNGLQLTMDGIGSYMMPCSNAYDQYTPGISSGSGGMIAGWPLMNQFNTVHDVEKLQIGFSVVKGCTTGKAPLRANVTMGQPAPGFNPSSPSGTTLVGSTAKFQLTFSFDPTSAPTSFQAALINDMATALGVSSSRLSLTQVTSSNGQAQITFQLTPTSSASDVTPSQALETLKAQLATSTSPIYSGVYSKYVLKSSLNVLSNGELSAASIITISSSLILSLIAFVTIIIQRL